MITMNIDLKKLDKSRFKEFTRKNGNQGLGCDLVLFPMKKTPGKFLVKQSCTKEERDNGLDLPILGEATDRNANNDAF